MNDPTANPDSYLDFAEVKRRTRLSRATIWRQERAGRFPQRRQLLVNRVAWLESEISAWIAARPVGLGRRPATVTHAPQAA